MKKVKKSTVRAAATKRTAKSARLGRLAKAKKCYEVRSSVIHGRGVFAATRIAKGERVIEYTGERMSHAEADRRYGRLHDGNAHTMLMAADEKVVIDATKRGSAARWINHSCAPNCEAVEDEGRVYIEARRAIRVGEELAYDYDLIVEERHTAKLKREHACRCGAKTCRGTLLGKKR